jgi:hypothetical protein
MSKPFSKSLYDTNDGAKYIVIDYLIEQGYKAWVNPDQYGIDVLAEKDLQSYEFEVEVKHNWNGFSFPFDEVHFAARKLKVAKNSPTNFFVMLNHQKTRGLMVNGKDFLESNIVTKSTIYTANEKFVEVPISKVTFFKTPIMNKEQHLLESKNG